MYWSSKGNTYPITPGQSEVPPDRSVRFPKTECPEGHDTPLRFHYQSCVVGEPLLGEYD